MQPDTDWVVFQRAEDILHADVRLLHAEPTHILNEGLCLQACSVLCSAFGLDGPSACVSC